MLQAKFKDDNEIEAGIDEVGRGCLWGPLVTGAVIWPPEAEWSEEVREVSSKIRDSKKLSEKKRTELASEIEACAIDFAIGEVSPQEIDELGMTASNQLAFARAKDGLTVEPSRLLVDGIIALKTEDWSGEQHTIVEGDAKYIAIAAASILAKHKRDSWVKEWCKANPEIAVKYGLESSKGYGTAKHRAAIEKDGPHLMHRRLFLRKILGDDIHHRKNQFETQKGKFLFKDD
jgi:ribonuclease HII